MENKMTLEELLETIKEKKENARNDVITQNYGSDRELSELYGSIKAYSDLIDIIESRIGKE